MTAQLTLNQLGFERNEQPLLQQLSVTLNPGELLQIRGANGSGKSTLLRILAGFIEPHAGTVEWQGKAISSQLGSYQQQLHYLGHHNGIKPSLTVYENLLLHCSLVATKPSSQELNKMIAGLGLQALTHSLTQFMSAGQLRRLSLARLLLSPASLWLLDEPMTALDTEGQAIFMSALQQHLLKNGMAIVATHHDLALTSPIKLLELGASDV